MDGYWHGKPLSDASWLMFRSMYTSGAWTDILLGKLLGLLLGDVSAGGRFIDFPQHFVVVDFAIAVEIEADQAELDGELDVG